MWTDNLADFSRIWGLKVQSTISSYLLSWFWSSFCFCKRCLFVLTFCSLFNCYLFLFFRSLFRFLSAFYSSLIRSWTYSRYGEVFASRLYISWKRSAVCDLCIFCQFGCVIAFFPFINLSWVLVNTGVCYCYWCWMFPKVDKDFPVPSISFHLESSVSYSYDLRWLVVSTSSSSLLKEFCPAVLLFILNMIDWWRTIIYLSIRSSIAQIH